MTEIIYRDLTPEELEERRDWESKSNERARLLVEENRKALYQNIADPLFFGFQRGDNTEQEWLDAVQAVKDKYPYPDGV